MRTVSLWKTVTSQGTGKGVCREEAAKVKEKSVSLGGKVDE